MANNRSDPKIKFSFDITDYLRLEMIFNPHPVIIF